MTAAHDSAHTEEWKSIVADVLEDMVQRLGKAASTCSVMPTSQERCQVKNAKQTSRLHFGVVRTVSMATGPELLSQDVVSVCVLPDSSQYSSINSLVSYLYHISLLDQTNISMDLGYGKQRHNSYA